MLKRLMRALRPPRRWLVLYAALLAASFGYRGFRAAQWKPTTPFVTVPAADDAGPVAGRDERIAYLRWGPPDGATAPGRLPVILIHGSPGAASNFARLAPLIADGGRDVYALDLPGFGQSSHRAPSYSVVADARVVLEAMSALGVERAHVVGWSLGGGVALHMADLAPGRVASVTLLASIGVQEAEGSGDYYFEHAKYAIGYGLLVVAPEFIPHFGLLGSFWERRAFILSFWDTDMRPMRALMERLRTPTLILHGRNDFLVPAWGAELHHELIASSRLVMLDASHFIPFIRPQAREAARHLNQFFDRHDDPAASVERTAASYAPVSDVKKKVGPFQIAHDTPWWAIILFIIVGTIISEDATVIAVGLLIAAGEIDLGVGFIGCMVGIAVGDALLWAIGRFWGRRVLHWPVVREWLPEKALERWGRAFDQHAVKAVFLARALPGTRLPMYIAAGLLSQRAHRFLFWAAIAVVLWTPMLLLVAALVGPPIHGALEEYLGGTLGLVAALILLFVGVRVVVASTTRMGRLRLWAAVRKPSRPEFWPPWIFYLPLAPWIMLLSLRNRGAMTFTCLNPGVPGGGGVVGESKHQILTALARGGAGAWIVPTEFVDAGPAPALRAEVVDELVRNEPALGGYPIVLKPDEAQRGHGFKVVASRDQAEAYFVDMTRPAILQRFHPGPQEVGVLWARIPGARPDAPGEIFSVTRKHFPFVEGDGRRTLEDLIWAYPRLRMQATVFLKRFADQLDRVPAPGERVQLAIAGNHCQGVMFLDGADLITPALTQRVDAIARAFPGDAFDFGRFDLRYDDEGALRRGEGFAIVELNGAMSESTNLYDPGRPIWWTYGVLFRQWRRMYELGAERRARGVRPMTFAELHRALRDHFKGRPGSTIAD